MALFFAGVGIFVVTLAAVLLYAKWERSRRRAAGKAAQAMLPPGSMGLPYVGETLQLYSQNPNVFFSTRQKRYGEIFKTNLLGCDCVMLGSPEAAHFVLVSQAHLFRPTYPASKELLIGPNALFFHQGGYHLRLRRLVQRSLGPDTLRALVPDVEAAAAATLRAWDGNVASTFQAMKRLSFDVGVVTIFGLRLDRRFKEELRNNYFVVEKGYNSFPNCLPGSRYQKAIKARKGLRATLGEIVAERRTRDDDAGGECGLLDTLMRWRDDDTGAALDDDQIADNVIGVLFAAQDTTASVLTWILKYLHDDPKLLKAVKEEQMVIYEENGGGKEALTWTQTRGMPLTHRVILESMRMASIISFTFREAVDDVVYNGFLIPKGWKVMPLFRNIHHSPENFKDPQVFAASRFKAAPPRPGTFLPFGSGVHACPGNELAKLEVLVFVHRLVTAYRWEVVGPSDEAEYSPFPVPKHGLKARLWSDAAAIIA